jgi:hypothetical protein
LIGLGKPTGAAAADPLRVRAWEVKEAIDIAIASKDLSDQRQKMRQQAESTPALEDEVDEGEDNQEALEQEPDEELSHRSPSWGNFSDLDPLPPPLHAAVQSSASKAAPVASSSKVSTSKVPAQKAAAPKVSASKPKASTSKRPAHGNSSEIEVMGPGPKVPKKRKADNDVDVHRVRKTTAVITKTPTQRGRQSHHEGTLERLEGFLDPAIDKEAAKEAAAVRREDGLAQLMLLGKNSDIEVLTRTIDALRRDLSDERDKRVQAERTVDQTNNQMNMMSMFMRMGGQAGGAAGFGGAPFGGAPFGGAPFGAPPFGAAGGFGAPLFGAGAAPFHPPAANPAADWPGQGHVGPAHERAEPPLHGVAHPFERDGNPDPPLEDL